MVILDEADQLFLDDTIRSSLDIIIKTHFINVLNINPIYVLFSATLNDHVKNQIDSYINQPTVDVYAVKLEALKLANIKQLKFQVEEDMAKRKFLEMFFKTQTSQAMIFVNTKTTADFLQSLIIKWGKEINRTIEARILTGKMSDNERDRTIDDFRKGRFSAIICTNVLARGIDIPEVDIVINYDIPQVSNAQFYEADTANYLHRIGRTGRFQTDGLSVTFYLGSGINAETE